MNREGENRVGSRKNSRKEKDGRTKWRPQKETERNRKRNKVLFGV